MNARKASLKFLWSVTVLATTAVALSAQEPRIDLNGIWEFDLDILGDRNVHRFNLQLNGNKLTGRGMFGATVSGEARIPSSFW
jgi:hypothetical protein